MTTQKICTMTRNTIRSISTVIGLCAIATCASGQPMHNAKLPPSTWHGGFTDGAASETLTLRDGNLYLYKGGGEPATLVGTVKGYNTGQLGLYVANLDGNEGGRQSIAFFDPDRTSWYWGSIDEGTVSWTPAGENVDGKMEFHLANGPTFIPADQLTQDPPATATAGRSVTALSTPALTPFVYPAEGSQYDALARSQHVWTHFILFADGNLYASTRVKEDTALAGFHAGATVALFTSQDLRTPLVKLSSPDIGVTGTWFGHSDVTASWQGQVPSQLLPRLSYYAVVQKWTPDWLAALRDVKKFTDAIVGIVKPLESLFGK